ncbi:MAG: hypothetical protein MUC47_03295 [Candidatus Kapabacteria bacterium]|nr:hypothetical protein [Candidatus Kapabacteria bacterium]
MRRCIHAALAAVVIASNAHGQDVVRVSGGIGLSTDMTHRTGGLTSPGIPDVIHRASVQLSVTLFDDIVLPFSAYVTSLDAGYTQPFNQFGIHPRFGDALTVHAGYFSQRISDLSFGDARLFGVGVEASPGQFRASAFYGTTMEARNPDATRGFSGDYLRRAWGGSFGYKSDGGGAQFNVLYATDDETSIRPDSTTRPPAENLVTTLSFSASAGEALTFDGEIGLAMYTADVRASLLDSNDRNPFVESLIAFNSSTSLDYAGKASAALTVSEHVSFRGGISWLGPGYISLGFVQMFNDMLDITISPTIRIGDNTVILQGTVGQRTNNLAGTRESAMSQLIISANVTSRLSDDLSVDISLANFGQRNSARNDTLRISNISRYLSASPRYVFTALGLNHTLSATVFIQESEDQNILSPNRTKNDNRSIGLSHILSIPSGWSFTTSLNHFASATNGLELTLLSINESINTSLFDNTVNTGLTLGINAIQSAAGSTQLFARFFASRSFDSFGTLMLVLATNSFDYAATGALAATESNGSLQYSISF